MQVNSGAVVSLTYTLTDDEGVTIDTNVGHPALVYLHGHENIIPGLEKGLEGASKGDKLDVVCEGGIQRGTHVLKALSLGAKACSGGRMYLYALAAAGQPGVERALGQYRTEIERAMKLMGVKSVSELNRGNLRFR